jgi:hypothetical protein
MRLERKSLDDLIRTQPGFLIKEAIWDPILVIPEWALPDFADILTRCGDGVTVLNARVDLAEQLARLRNTFGDVCGELPPTIIEQANSALQGAADVIRRAQLAPEDISNAKSLLGKADAWMSNQGQDGTFASSIASRLKRLRWLFGIGSEDQNRLENTEVYRRFKDRLTGAFNVVENAGLTDANNIAPEDYRFLDTETLKLELVLDYVRLYQGGDLALQGELQNREDRLFEELQLESWEALKCARTIVREMQTGIYPEDLKQELEAVAPDGNGADDQPRGPVSIEMDRLVARQGEPLELFVQFHNRALDHAPARDEWTPMWKFPQNIQEKWWAVWHYFEDTGPKKVTVHFEGADGRPIAQVDGPLSLSRTINVAPAQRANNRARLGAEILRLSIALFVAVIALLAGARDQLTKLDMLQGLLAVFVMGFGADTIKNLVTQGPKRSGSA